MASAFGDSVIVEFLTGAGAAIVDCTLMAFSGCNHFMFTVPITARAHSNTMHAAFTLISRAKCFFCGTPGCLFHSIDTLKVRAQDKRPLLPWSKISTTTPILRPAVILRSLYQGFSTNLFLKAGKKILLCIT